jgi:hypothetical protein
VGSNMMENEKMGTAVEKEFKLGPMETDLREIG